ncbi:MAG TPA: carbon-nitrogen hydrolase family protein [Polyangiaceae bacterium]|jgi:predicted amidohydrolase
MANQTVRVAAIQLESQADVSENLERAAVLVARAATAGAELVLLPENFAFFGPEADKRERAERLGDHAAPIQGALAGWARAHRLFVVGGGFPERSSDPARPFNTAAVFAPSGELIASYRKLHLFDVDLADGSSLRESAATSAGSEVTTFDVSGFRFGLSICYDLRFPELYRALVERGAHALLVPAAFTLHTGKDHWHPLLRARAIESQCWLVAAAQWGKHPGERRTYGHSLVVDPWGTIVAEASDRPGFILADLDRAYLESVRRAVPCLTHRKQIREPDRN